MQINRTCTIELSRDEVAEALTKYIQEKHRYSTDEIRPWHEVLSWTSRSHYRDGGSILLVWGEKPKPAPEPVECGAPAEPTVA